MTVTLEINGRRVQVDDAFRSMTPEQQQAAVDEIASSMGFAQQGQMRADPTAMQWLNRGIAGGVDSLVGLANAVPNAAIRAGANLFGVDDPFQFGSTPTADLMDMAGIRATQDPQTLAQHALVGAGEGVSALIPAGAAARGLSGAGGVTGAIARGMNNAMVSAPVASSVAEALGGAGARVGGEMAASAAGGEYGDMARPFGSLAGGAAAALGPGAAARALVGGADLASRSMPFVSTARAILAREAAPFTERGAREVAHRSLRGMAADPQDAASRIDTNSPLTPAQQTGDIGLMALENEIIRRNPNMRPEFEQRNVDTLRGLSAQADSMGGDVAAAQSYLGGRVDAIRAQIDDRIEEAQAEAQRRIESLSPQRAASENSVIVREEIDKAYQAAKADENRLWGMVPDDIPVPTDNAKAATRSALDMAGPVSESAVPAIAKRWLASNSGFGETAPIRDIQRLYSELRQHARNARGGQEPNAFSARLADEIADGILADFDLVPDTAGEAYRAARAYTAQMREAFNQGTVGRVRQRTDIGSPSIPPELALDRTIGSGGTRAAVAIDDITGVAGTPATQDALADYLLGRLSQRGTPTPQRMDAFGRQYAEALQRVSPVAKALGAARSGVARSEEVTRRGTRVAEALSGSDAARLASSRPETAVSETVFRSADPVASARRLAQQARRNPDAMEGLKRGAVEHVISQARGSFLKSGDRSISGNTINGLMQDPVTRGALSEILDASEIRRLETIGRELQLLEMSRSAAPSGRILDVEPNRLISYIGGTIAARFGAQMGAGTSGASLRTASEATKRFNRFIENLTGGRAERLIIDAVQDPELFRALLTNAETPRAQQEVMNRVRLWAEGAGISAMSQSNEDD